MPTKANLAIYQGDDYAAVVAVTDGGGPADLTGVTAQAQIRVGAADLFENVVLEITTSIVMPNSVTLAILATDTARMSGKYAWDLQLTLPGGVVSTILAGDVIVTPEVTRET